MRNKLPRLYVAIGASVASLTLASTSASAINLTKVETMVQPSDWTKLGWAAEGRAGARGGADYEYAIGSNGAKSDNTGQIYRDWTNNGENVNWSLNWNGTIVSFMIGTKTISYDPIGNLSNFGGFSLETQAITELGKVDPGTKMFFSVTQANGTNILNDVSSTSIAPISGKDSEEIFFSSDESILSLAGIARMSWDTGDVNPNAKAARSRLYFKIRGFDTGDHSPDDSVSRVAVSVQSVPEPSSIVSTLVLGAFGVSSLMKRRQEYKV